MTPVTRGSQMLGREGNFVQSEIGHAHGSACSAHAWRQEQGPCPWVEQAGADVALPPPARVTMLEEELGRMAPDLGAVEEWRRRDAEYAQRLRDLEAATSARNEVRPSLTLLGLRFARYPCEMLLCKAGSEEWKQASSQRLLQRCAPACMAL